MHISRRLLALLATLLLLSACAPYNSGVTTATPTVPAQSPTSTAIAICPAQLGPTCRTPYDLRVAYGVQSLIQRGFTGKGQTIVDIVSYGSPTLQQDMNVFDKQFGLPPVNVKVMSPIGTVPLNPPPKDLTGWEGETELDVQVIHAIAPDAGIVILTSPVDETEGTIGLPQFRQLEQYALTNHLGNIISQSFGASEVFLLTIPGSPV